MRQSLPIGARAVLRCYSLQRILVCSSFYSLLRILVCSSFFPQKLEQTNIRCDHVAVLAGLGPSRSSTLPWPAL